MDLIEVVLILGVGLVAGAINTLAGGGSLLSLPILIFLGLPPAVANATNRVAIFSQNIFAVAGFRSKGIAAFWYSFVLGIFALMGAIIGAKVAVDIKGELFNKILAVVMIVVVVFTVSGNIKPNDVKTENTGFPSKVLVVWCFFSLAFMEGLFRQELDF